MQSALIATGSRRRNALSLPLLLRRALAADAEWAAALSPSPLDRRVSRVAIILIGESRAHSSLATADLAISNGALSHWCLASISNSAQLCGEATCTMAGHCL